MIGRRALGLSDELMRYISTLRRAPGNRAALRIQADAAIRVTQQLESSISRALGARDRAVDRARKGSGGGPYASAAPSCNQGEE